MIWADGEAHQPSLASGLLYTTIAHLKGRQAVKDSGCALVMASDDEANTQSPFHPDPLRGHDGTCRLTLWCVQAVYSVLSRIYG